MKYITPTLEFFIFFINFSLQEKSYKFRPESRQIDVDASDTFYIGFDEIQNKTHLEYCYIHSSVVSIDYPLHHHEHHQAQKAIEMNNFKGFIPYKSVCAFTYSTANNNVVPSKWTIKAYDNYTRTNVTEEVVVRLYYKMPVYVNRLVGLEGGTIVNFFQSGRTKLKKCSIRFENVTLNLELNSIRVYNHDNIIFKSRLFSIGEGKCGYKINALLPSDSISITLFATDINNKTYRNTSPLIVVKKGERLKNRTQEVYLGDSTTIICGKETDGSANSDQKFCYLYNPKGDLVSNAHMCQYSLDIVTIDDLGNWTCSVGYDYIMDTLEFTTKLVQKKSESISTFSKNSTNYYTIGCQLVNFSRTSLSYCRFTRPDGKIFKVTNGAATTNYNTFSSDLANGKCALEIVKPLRKEDIGTWKCETVFYGDEMSGAFINVDKAKCLPYKKHKQKNIRLGNSFLIDCTVPYQSDYCYVIAPNGTQYKPKNLHQISAGLCMFKVEKSEMSDNGTWECSIAQKNGFPDEIIKIEISIIDLKVLYNNAEATEDTNVELSCNTNGIPIEYCRFVSPAGLSYSLRKGSVTSSRISYFGRGLEYGDCGIKIINVTLSQQGQWICHISSGRYNYKNKADLTRKIQLTVIPLLSASTILKFVGVVFGVLILVIFGGVLFCRYSKRNKCCKTDIRVPLQYSDRASQSSNDSATLSISTPASALYTPYRRQPYTANE